MAKKQKKSRDGKGPSGNELGGGEDGRKKVGSGLTVKMKRTTEDAEKRREKKKAEKKTGESESNGPVESRREEKKEKKEEKKEEEKKEKKEKEKEKKKKDKEKKKQDKEKEVEEDKAKKVVSSVSPKKRKDRTEMQEDEDGGGKERKKKVKKDGRQGFKRFEERWHRGRASRRFEGDEDEDGANQGEEVMPPPTDRSNCKGRKNEMQVITDESGEKSYKCDGCGRVITSYYQMRRHKWKINSWRRKVGLPPLEGDDEDGDRGTGKAGVTKKKKKVVKRFKRDGKPQVKHTSVCKAWQKGECRYGAGKCRFRHELDSAASTDKGGEAKTQFRLEKEEPLPGRDSAKKGKLIKKMHPLKSKKLKKLSTKNKASKKS